MFSDYLFTCLLLAVLVWPFSPQVFWNWARGKLPSRQTGGQSNPHKWLASRKIWSVEKLETLPAGTKPRTWHLERGVEKESARRSPSKGRERAIVNQTNIGTVSKATLGKLLRDGVECIIMGFSERIDIILNWTKWTELSQSFERCITVLTVDSLGPVEENFQPLTF